MSIYFQVIWCKMLQVLSNDISDWLGPKSQRSGLPLGLLCLRLLQTPAQHRGGVWDQWKQGPLQTTLHGDSRRRVHLIRWWAFDLKHTKLKVADLVLFCKVTIYLIRWHNFQKGQMASNEIYTTSDNSFWLSISCLFTWCDPFPSKWKFQETTFWLVRP